MALFVVDRLAALVWYLDALLVVTSTADLLLGALVPVVSLALFPRVAVTLLGVHRRALLTVGRLEYGVWVTTSNGLAIIAFQSSIFHFQHSFGEIYV